MAGTRADARTRHPRDERRGEARLPGVVATLIAITLYLALPERLLIAPRYVLPALELLLLVTLIAINPRRLTRRTREFRLLSLTLVAVIAVSNLVALGMLVHQLLYAEVKDGRGLLVAALQVWLTHIIVFGLAYWELDRGGPVSRTRIPRAALPLADRHHAVVGARQAHDERRIRGRPADLAARHRPGGQRPPLSGRPSPRCVPRRNA